MDEITSYPVRLEDFQYRQPDDASDIKVLGDVQRHGWHIVGIQPDEAGPGFAFTVGVYLRTVQPEILIMGLDTARAGKILNLCGDYLLNGGRLVPEQRYTEFVNGYAVMFRPVARNHFPDYLGYALWFYRQHSRCLPVLQCIWPDKSGVFPHEPGYDDRLGPLQSDLST